MGVGLRIDKRRERELNDTVLVTPHGSEITVTKSRAEALLSRTPIRMGDGSARTYARPGESNVVEVATTTNAKPPRKGDGRNAED